MSSNKIIKVLNTEHEFIKKMISRSLKKFKNHPRQRKLIQLSNLLKCHVPNHTMILICDKIYVTCSQEVYKGHFISYNMCIMASVARISFLCKKYLKIRVYTNS